MASKHYHFKFNFDSDKEIISRIEEQENKNDYIRSLILSDIAADILRDSIKLEDVKEDVKEDSIGEYYPTIFKSVDTDDVSHYYHENEYNERVEFYYEHCQALNNLDTSKNYCIDCKYTVQYMDIDGIKKTCCSLEDAWLTHWNHILYDAAGGAKRDYPAEFKGLKKDEDYMTNLHKISKTYLNSLYGKMVRDPFKEDVIDNMMEHSNASNALDNDIKKGDPDNG